MGDKPDFDNKLMNLDAVYWIWKEALALLSLDLSDPFLVPMGLRLRDPMWTRSRARSTVELTLTRAGVSPDPKLFMSAVRRTLVDLAHEQSPEDTYSLWCFALRGRPTRTISESLAGWINVFSSDAFWRLLPPRQTEALSGHIHQFIAEDAEWAKKTAEAVEEPLSEWDQALLAGGYYDDPKLRYYPDALIDDIIRWRRMRRLWVVVSAVIGTAGINELRQKAQSILGPPDAWPRLRWPDGTDFGVDE